MNTIITTEAEALHTAISDQYKILNPLNSLNSVIFNNFFGLLNK